ncbi:MAG: hypothetical protein Q9M19_05840, partial [Mariprofundaceae bacterium]|nr:hypothetical protein [Mariprofundaceae bacterium]
QECYKPCIFVVNKWDLGRKAQMTPEAWGEYLFSEFGSMRHVPVAFVTARTGWNLRAVIRLARSLHRQARRRVSTGPVNRAVREALLAHPPPFRRNKRPKIYYATQVGTEPPTLVLKCNDPELFSAEWKRYLTNFLQERLGFPEVPLRLVFRAHHEPSPPPSLEEAPLSAG